MGTLRTNHPVKATILTLCEPSRDMPWRPRFTGRVHNGTRHAIGARGLRT